MAFKLMPQHTPLLLASPDSSITKRGAFATKVRAPAGFAAATSVGGGVVCVWWVKRVRVSYMRGFGAIGDGGSCKEAALQSGEMHGSGAEIAASAAAPPPCIERRRADVGPEPSSHANWLCSCGPALGGARNAQSCATFPLPAALVGHAAQR